MYGLQKDRPHKTHQGPLLGMGQQMQHTISNATSALHSRGSPTAGAGSKIRNGYLPHAFSWAQKRAEMLHHPYNLGDPQTRGTKSEVAASPCLLRGAQEGGNAPSPMIPWGCPTPSAKGKIRNGYPTMPPRSPKRGRKCYITLASSWVQNQKWRPHSSAPAFSGAQKRAEMRFHPCNLREPEQRGTE